MGGLTGLAKERYLVKGKLAHITLCACCCHFKRVNNRGRGGGKTCGQVLFIVRIHQKPNGAAVHAIDRQAFADKRHIAHEGFKHKTISAKGYNGICVGRINIAVTVDQLFFGGYGTALFTALKSKFFKSFCHLHLLTTN